MSIASYVKTTEPIKNFRKLLNQFNELLTNKLEIKFQKKEWFLSIGNNFFYLKCKKNIIKIEHVSSSVEFCWWLEETLISYIALKYSGMIGSDSYDRYYPCKKIVSYKDYLINKLSRFDKKSAISHLDFCLHVEPYFLINEIEEIKKYYEQN